VVLLAELVVLESRLLPQDQLELQFMLVAAQHQTHKIIEVVAEVLAGLVEWVEPVVPDQARLVPVLAVVAQEQHGQPLEQ
jgi:hypothetical protein